MKALRIALTVALACLLAAALGGCAPKKDTTAATTPDPAGIQPAGTPGTEGPAGGPAEIGLNESGTAGDWSVKITKVERAPEAGGAAAAEGGELVVITMDLTNNGSAGKGIGPTDMKLAKADGSAEFEAAPTSDPAFIFNIPQPINAGETRVVKIAYNVPTGTTGLSWTFDPFIEGGAPSPVVVKLD